MKYPFTTKNTGLRPYKSDGATVIRMPCSGFPTQRVGIFIEMPVEKEGATPAGAEWCTVHAFFNQHSPALASVQLKFMFYNIPVAFFYKIFYLREHKALNNRLKQQPIK